MAGLRPATALLLAACAAQQLSPAWGLLLSAAGEAASGGEDFPEDRSVAVKSSIEGYMRIRTHLPPRRRAPSTEPPRRIPRVIYQTMRRMDHDLGDRDALWVKRDRGRAMTTVIDANPTWEYRLFDDVDIEKMIRTEWPGEYLEVFHAITQGASKADFWRYLVLWRHGGAYIDTDAMAKPEYPFDDWIAADAEYMAGLGAMDDTQQWGLFVSPGNCVMRKALERMWLRFSKKVIYAQFLPFSTAPDRSGDFHWISLKGQWRGRTGVSGFLGPGALNEAVQMCMVYAKERDRFLDGFRLCTFGTNVSTEVKYSTGLGGRIIAKALPVSESAWNQDALPFKNITIPTPSLILPEPVKAAPLPRALEELEASRLEPKPGWFEDVKDAPPPCLRARLNGVEETFERDVESLATMRGCQAPWCDTLLDTSNWTDEQKRIHGSNRLPKEMRPKWVTDYNNAHPGWDGLAE